MSDPTLADFSAVAPQHIANPSRLTDGADAAAKPPLFSQQDLDRSLAEIQSWSGYAATPLRSLGGLADKLNVAGIVYKDEASRFGLGSFKALGGAYAVSQLGNTANDSNDPPTIATATDGNHGLSVAWGAANHGYRAVVYIHAKVSKGREVALRKLGADVIRIEGNYDDSVRRCYADAAANHWHVVSDTTSNGHGESVARSVMTGYSVMAAEIVNQAGERAPSHVFVQGGVGGLAATVCAYFQRAYGTSAPRFIVVEPELAACLFASGVNRAATAVRIDAETAMAGLSCGEVSAVAWPVLKQYADDFMTIPESYVAPAMQLLAHGAYGTTPVIAGESAIAGLAGFVGAALCPRLRSALGIDQSSSVLVLGTEGATDPDLYAQMTGRSVEDWQCRSQPEA